MRMAAPPVQRRPCRVVIRIVVRRHVDGSAVGHIPIKFLFQRVAVVFEMVEDIQRTTRRICHQTGADLVGHQKGAQACRLDLGLPHLGPAADRDHAVIGKPAQERRGWRDIGVTETAERLRRQGVFPHAVKVVGHRHAAPAHPERRLHVRLRPVHKAAQLVPIGHLLERQMFDRRAGDDQPVELFARRLHLGERAIERLHMRGGGVFRLMLGHPDQLEIDLQRRGPDQPGELVFGLDLLGHQVQQPDPQRADVLMRRPVRRHHHHAFVAQNVEGGQGRGQGDRHGGRLRAGGTMRRGAPDQSHRRSDHQGRRRW